MVFQIDTLRVDKRDHSFYFDNFATPAQAENYRRQFRKIISQDVVKITCGKSKVDKSKFPPPYNPATLLKGRMEVYATAETFDIIYLMLEMSLSLYVSPRKLFVMDVETEEVYQPVMRETFGRSFPVGQEQRFGELYLEQARPYQINTTNHGFSPPVVILQVDKVHNIVFSNSLPYYTPINHVIERLGQFTKNLDYQVRKEGTKLYLSLHLQEEDLFVTTVMLFFALDIALFGYRILISPDLFDKPERAFEISQVV
jgi:hypothetical protein